MSHGSCFPPIFPFEINHSTYQVSFSNVYLPILAFGKTVQFLTLDFENFSTKTFTKFVVERFSEKSSLYMLYRAFLSILIENIFYIFWTHFTYFETNRVNKKYISFSEKGLFSNISKNCYYFIRICKNLVLKNSQRKIVQLASISKKRMPRVEDFPPILKNGER